ncbi:tRNA dihydrouridine synthase [Naganishia albida]|nr:tRNA dihydrouridine synthase [Naganishia albida]
MATSTPPAKLHGYEFYKSIGSPQYVIAPMVDQSELAWRVLSRQPIPPSYLAEKVGSSGSSTPSDKSSDQESSTTKAKHPIGGAHLCYTPMIHAKMFAQDAESAKQAFTYEQFDFANGEEGSSEPLAGLDVSDRPLFVQFCANEPEWLLKAAKRVEKHCDAVDINFGCPQGIAKRGKYGSFLQDEWELIYQLINTLHTNLSIPVTAKFRIFPDVNKTIAYAQMMERAGASILTCHGRTREMKGQITGLADWEQIKAVKEAVKIPVFANGNILYKENVDQCLEKTGVDGIMTAEGNLSNPSLFVPEDSPVTYPPIHVLAHHYLDIVERLKTRTAGSAIKAHLFRLLKPGLEKHIDIRNKLGEMYMKEGTGVSGYRALIDELKAKLEQDERENPISTLPVTADPVTGLKSLPSWASQPYVRPLPAGTVFSASSDARKQGAMNDLATGGTGEERVAGLDGTPTSLQVSTLTPCVQKECANTAGNKCDRNACLIHCRALGGVKECLNLPEAERVTIEQAIALAQSGQLVGKGCEAHEAKDLARRERKAGKRKAKAQWKAEKQDNSIELSASQEKKRKQREGSPAAMTDVAGPQLTNSSLPRPEDKKLKLDAVVS